MNLIVLKKCCYSSVILKFTKEVLHMRIKLLKHNPQQAQHRVSHGFVQSLFPQVTPELGKASLGTTQNISTHPSQKF